MPIYSDEHGGAVLNAAITQYAHGSISQGEGADFLSRIRREQTGVSYRVDVPPGSGLGASAAQTVLWVALVKTTIANTSDRREVAQIACQIGQLLGIVGGKQDEYASALGGISFLTFGDSVEAERLELDRTLASDLRSRLILVYSGASRMSGSIHERVWARYRSKESGVVAALHRLRELAGEMKEALLTRDLQSFGQLLDENWSCQKALDPSVTYSELDGVMELAAANGSIGGKACGAGGGGCLIFLAKEGEKDRVLAALRMKRLQIIDFDFDTYGVHLTKG